MGLISKVREATRELSNLSSGLDNAARSAENAQLGLQRFQDNVDVPDFGDWTGTGGGGTGGDGLGGGFFSFGGPPGGTRIDFGGGESGRLGPSAPTGPTPRNTFAGQYWGGSWLGMFGMGSGEASMRSGGGSGGAGGGGGTSGGSFKADPYGEPPWWGDAPEWLRDEYASYVAGLNGRDQFGRRAAFVNLSEKAKAWIRNWWASHGKSASSESRGGSAGGGGGGGGDRELPGYAGFSVGAGVTGVGGVAYGGGGNQPGAGGGGSPFGWGGESAPIVGALNDLGMIQQEAMRRADENNARVVSALERVRVVDDGGAGNRAQGLI